MSAYVIFSPHSHCTKDGIRNCDIRAGNAAQLMYDKLIKNGVTTEKISWVKHNILRSDYDLNRFPSRDVEARRELRSTVMKLYNDKDIKRIYLLEIHSFPYGWESDVQKIAIINREETYVNGILLAEELGGRKNGIYAFLGTEHIDIQNEYAAGRDKIIPFMIEVHESHDKISDIELDKNFNIIAAKLIEGFEPAQKTVEIIIVRGDGIGKLPYYPRVLIVVFAILVLVLILYFRPDLLDKIVSYVGGTLT